MASPVMQTIDRALPGSLLIISGLDSSLDTSQVSLLFEDYGQSEECHVFPGTGTDESLNVALLRMKTLEEAKAVFETFDKGSITVHRYSPSHTLIRHMLELSAAEEDLIVRSCPSCHSLDLDTLPEPWRTCNACTTTFQVCDGYPFNGLPDGLQMPGSFLADFANMSPKPSDQSAQQAEKNLGDATGDLADLNSEENMNVSDVDWSSEEVAGHISEECSDNDDNDNESCEAEQAAKPLKAIERMKSNGLRLAKDATHTSSSVELLRAFNTTFPLSKGLPALIEDIAAHCDAAGLLAMQSVCKSFAETPQTQRFARSYNTSKTICDLPVEILSLIAERCEHLSLKTFRLVCKLYAKIGRSYLCDTTLNIFNTTDSLEKLGCYTSFPELSRKITCLNLYVAEFQDFDTRAAWARDIAYTHCPGCEALEELPIATDSVSDNQYYEFCRMLVNQAHIRNILLQEALEDAFEDLRNIDTLFLYSGYQMVSRAAVRRPYRKLLKQVGAAPITEPQCNTRTFISSMLAVEASDVQIKHLFAGRIDLSFLSSENPVNATMLPRLRKSMINIETLTIVLDLQRCQTWYIHLDGTLEDIRAIHNSNMKSLDRGRIGMFMHKAVNLRSLDVDFGGTMKHLSSNRVVNQVFGAKAWANLESLTISGCTASHKQVLALLTRHKGTLRYVSLTDMSIPHGGGDWPTFFDDFREAVKAGQLKLAALEFHGFFEWVETEGLFMMRKQMCSDGDDGCRIGGGVAGYILDGSPCPWADAESESIVFTNIGVGFGI